jgi:hypothetical protein
MKKFFYSILVALAVTVSVSSCTEENVTPASKNTSGGGRTLGDNEMVG